MKSSAPPKLNLNLSQIGKAFGYSMPTKRTPPKKTPTKKSAKPKPVTPTGVITRSKSPLSMSLAQNTAASAAPAISADMMAFIQMRKEERAEEREDKVAQERRHERQIELLRKQFDDTISALTSKNAEKAKPPTAKLPMFDIETDAENFKLWKSRWEIHIRAHNIHKIDDEEDRKNRLMLELNSGLTDNTLRWLQNRNFRTAELKDAEFLITAIQKYIHSNSNPTVKHVELGFIERYENESADNFYQRINAHADKCEFEAIKNFKNHSCLMTLLRGVDSSLRRKMLLAKVETYEEAVEIMKAEENATKDSDQCSVPNSGSANRVSAYKSDQKQRYANSNSSPNKDAQSSSRPFRCIRCHSTEHLAHRCPALIENKICNKCQTPGHLAHACLRESRERRHSFSDNRSNHQPHVSFAPTTKASANTVYRSVNHFSAYDSDICHLNTKQPDHL